MQGDQTQLQANSHLEEGRPSSEQKGGSGFPQDGSLVAMFVVLNAYAIIFQQIAEGGGNMTEKEGCE